MFDQIRHEIDKIEAALRAGKMDPRRVKYTVDRLIHEANTQATAFRMKLLGPLRDAQGCPVPFDLLPPHIFLFPCQRKALTGQI